MNAVAPVDFLLHVVTAVRVTSMPSRTSTVLSAPGESYEYTEDSLGAERTSSSTSSGVDVGRGRGRSTGLRPDLDDASIASSSSLAEAVLAEAETGPSRKKVLVEVSLDPGPDDFPRPTIIFQRVLWHTDRLSRVREAVQAAVEFRRGRTEAFFRRTYANSPQLWDLLTPEPEFRLQREGAGNVPTVVRLLSPDLTICDLLFEDEDDGILELGVPAAKRAAALSNIRARAYRAHRSAVGAPNGGAQNPSPTQQQHGDQAGPLSVSSSSGGDMIQKKKPALDAEDSTSMLQRRVVLHVVFLVRAFAEHVRRVESLPIRQPIPTEFFLAGSASATTVSNFLRDAFPDGLRFPFPSFANAGRSSLFLSAARNSHARSREQVFGGVSKLVCPEVAPLILAVWKSPKHRPRTEPLCRMSEPLLRTIDSFLGPRKTMGAITLLATQAKHTYTDIANPRALRSEIRMKFRPGVVMGAGGVSSGFFNDTGGPELFRFLTEQSQGDVYWPFRKADFDYCIEVTKPHSGAERTLHSNWRFGLQEFDMHRMRVVPSTSSTNHAVQGTTSSRRGDSSETRGSLSERLPFVSDRLPWGTIAI